MSCHCHHAVLTEIYTWKESYNQIAWCNIVKHACAPLVTFIYFRK